MTGTQAIAGALQRMEARPDNNLECSAEQSQANDGWDDQWGNWDDLGSDDPGWGDISS